MSRSFAERLLERRQLKRWVSRLTEAEAQAAVYDWRIWGRPEQWLPPGVWDAWFMRAGRGFGKTRAGSESIRQLVTIAATHGRVGLVGPTAADVRDVIVEGESGLLAVHPRPERPKYEPSKRRLTWPNGATATCYSAEEPDQLRGPQHDVVWMDEPASMPRGEEALDMARLGLRLGMQPRLIVTGTPRPRPWLRAFAAEPGVISTTGATYENLANLAPAFLRVILGRYEGTRLGRQELHAEWLDDVEGALWSAEALEVTRIASWSPADPWQSLEVELNRRRAQLGLGVQSFAAERRPWRILVAVDPPGETAECGIVVGAAPERGRAGAHHAVILADMSVAGPPEVWGAQVVAAYHVWGAQAVIAESNQGQDMVRGTIHAVDPAVPVRKVYARQTKKERAEPVSALYGRGWVHHVGYFGDLEGQMTSWVPGDEKSPDRLDALVHCVTALLQPVEMARATAHSPVGRRVRRLPT